MPNIEFKFDQSRIENLVTVNELINLQKDDVATIRDVLGKFVWDPAAENWVDVKVGQDQVGNLSLRELKEVTGSFMRRLRNEAVPLESNKT